KEKLIITAAPRNLSGSVKTWDGMASAAGEKIPEYEVLRGTSYLDWIGPAITRHSDGGAIRDMLTKAEAGKLSGKLLVDASTWKVGIWDVEDIKAGRRLEAEMGKAVESWLKESGGSEREASEEDDLNAEFIRNRLEWVYPYKNTVELPAKLTVTELKRRFAIIDEQDVPTVDALRKPPSEKPVFMQERRGFTAAEKGTLLHFAMQHFKLDELRSTGKSLESLRGEVGRQVERMVGDGVLSEPEAEIVDTGRVAAFFASEIGTRLLNSRRVQREMPFTLGLKSDELFSSPQGEEMILLQGVIDCCFEEDGGLVLLDYKTDYVREGLSAPEVIAKRYKLQLEYYSRALSGITGQIVKERCIYLFSTGETILI
ncbi:MAG: helicase-exonuclease AddAB subunit AddA, partial [Clostridiales bacterium]|nr:helicase-exonuclease AddAB subunit AddA [Clostridiales bacterium]